MPPMIQPMHTDEERALAVWANSLAGVVRLVVRPSPDNSLPTEGPRQGEAQEHFRQSRDEERAARDAWVARYEAELAAETADYFARTAEHERPGRQAARFGGLYYGGPGGSACTLKLDTRNGQLEFMLDERSGAVIGALLSDYFRSFQSSKSDGIPNGPAAIWSSESSPPAASSVANCSREKPEAT